MGGAYIHGHEPRERFGCDSECGNRYSGEQEWCVVVSKVSDLARTMSKIYAI